MRLFLDTAIVSDVEERLPTGLISGITTNPTLIKKSGRDPEDVYREMFNLGVMDLSIEVPGTDCTEFIANGFQAVRDWGSYATVKLPCTVEGLKACKYLEERNVRCNMTLVFSVSQAVLCGIARATYVSPFVGRVDDNGLDGLKLVKDICEVYCRQNIATKVLAASIRDAQSAAKAFSHGAYICTLPPKVFDNMSTHVLTDKGLEQFNRDFLA
jgi:transaldolase